MSAKFKAACITGGAGFIGAHLARRLLKQNISVCVLDNLSVGRIENVPPEARFVHGDILNPGDCARALEGCDVLFHLAARVAIRASFEFVVEDTLCNVTGTATVLRAAAQTGSVRKVVSASSMAVYGDNARALPIPETRPATPISPYGISKLALEQLTHRLAAVAGMESVALRLFNTYGPGQRLSPYVGVITIFTNALRAGTSPTIFGDGLQVRDFVHVQDVVSGFVQAMESPVTGETINIGTGAPQTVLEVFDLLARELASDIPPTHVGAVPGELRYAIASIEKAKYLLGYEPKYDFRKSVPGVVAEIIGHATESL
ncbi:MAG TPA: NAD-dependent epimerase/dehydratase family protein [Candidatus Angelobacter sp.]|jgi:UDP-glucose 4-epimerase|nr:NAD-dependent epimerase/dehydratase family protein [Candidatus Angelobacter sp.]